MTRRGGNVPGGGARRGTDGSVPRPRRGLLTGPPNAMVPQVQHYTDGQIEQWDAEDRLDDDERKRILEATAGRT